MNEYVDKVINLAFCTVPLTEEEKAYIISGYNENNKQEMFETAARKKVLPVVGKMMTSLRVDADFWEEKYTAFKERNIRITELISEVFQRFAKKGIDKICAFENYGAMLAAGTDIALYSSGDVDLYADVSLKQEIIDVMASLNYFPTQDNSHRRNINTEFLKKDGVIRINVAWKPLRRFLLPITIDAAKYFRWDEMEHYQDTEIKVPSPETLLYMCFLRIAVHGYSRSPDIRLYIDTFNSTRNNPDWKTVLRWAGNDHVKTKFIAVAAIAHDLIKLDVPIEILELAQNDEYAQKILNIAYDFDSHTLKYDPSGLKLLKLEAASDNKSLLGEVFQMLFPSKSWVKEYYSVDDESYFKAYMEYYKGFL